MSGSETIDGKAAIVTGGTAGLGRAFAAALGRCGAVVRVCDLDGEVMRTAAELRQLGLDVEGVVADVSTPEDVRSLVDETAAACGGVDILINNAGVFRASSVTASWEDALADFDYVIGTNLRGAYLCGRAVAPLMVARGQGCIVNVASDHIHNCGWPEPAEHGDADRCPWRDVRRRPGLVGVDVYDASKWALNGLTQNWARELRPHGVRVNNLCVGSTDSPMQRRFAGYDYADHPPPPEVLGGWMDPRRVAEIVIELVQEGRDGRSGDNIGLWRGHPTVLPAPSATLNLSSDFRPEDLLGVFRKANQPGN